MFENNHFFQIQPLLPEYHNLFPDTTTFPDYNHFTRIKPLLPAYNHFCPNTTTEPEYKLFCPKKTPLPNTTTFARIQPLSSKTTIFARMTPLVLEYNHPSRIQQFCKNKNYPNKSTLPEYNHFCQNTTKCLYSGKVAVLSEGGFIRAKRGCTHPKEIVFRQIGYIWAKWLSSGKSGCIRVR